MGVQISRAYGAHVLEVGALNVAERLVRADRAVMETSARSRWLRTPTPPGSSREPARRENAPRNPGGLNATAPRTVRVEFVRLPDAVLPPAKHECRDVRRGHAATVPAANRSAGQVVPPARLHGAPLVGAVLLAVAWLRECRNLPM
jgi:hypothetical protein